MTLTVCEIGPVRVGLWARDVLAVLGPGEASVDLPRLLGLDLPPGRRLRIGVLDVAVGEHINMVDVDEDTEQPLPPWVADVDAPLRGVVHTSRGWCYLLDLARLGGAS